MGNVALLFKEVIMYSRAILRVFGEFRKPGVDGNPHTGQSMSKNLRARIADYDRMMEAAKGKDMAGFNKPGSLKK